MDAFLYGITAFPTVVFTVLLAVVLVYWMFVVFGAFDVDILGGGDGLTEGAAEGVAEGAAEGLAEGAAEGLAEGAAEGLAEGAAEGLAEGAAEGVAEGAADGVAEGAADGVAEGAADGAGEGAAEAGVTFGGILSSLKLRSAPVTVVFSVLVLVGWVISYLTMRSLGPSHGFTHWLVGAVVLLGALVVGLLLTSVIVRPLAPLFKTHSASSRLDLIGQVCIVRTGKVTERFGQGIVETGGASQLIDIRCDDANRLKRGKRALIISFDDEREAFVVEPLDPMLSLPSELEGPA